MTTMTIMKIIAFFFSSVFIAAAFGYFTALGETKEEREAEVNAYRKDKIELDETELAIS